ncbi:MAG: hypothetical protein EBQ95_03955 [Gammaproteobacteria bacterium]|nr:hypothetical protein [Gammaproteobacteria bacterium]
MKKKHMVMLIGFYILSQPVWSLPLGDGYIVKSSDAEQISYPHQEILTSPELRSRIKMIAPGIHQDVLDKVVTSLECSNHYSIEHNAILTIIDYSLPSSEKRLWVIDLFEKKLLYHTYVAHGLKSGEKQSNFFSNQNNSRASSIGLYLTRQAYYGREGTSLRLTGIDRGFNDNADYRAIVMHGAFYVEEDFIKKYGRAGRSWGCPALPHSQSQKIIQSIKDNSMMVVYYPQDKWLLKSQYLNCQNYNYIPLRQDIDPANIPASDIDNREDVLFVNIPAKTFGGETAPIIAMKANIYKNIFQKPIPMERMIRRRIHQEEYIALSTTEFTQMTQKNDPKELQYICFIVPSLKNNRGYFQTVIRAVNLGNISQLNTLDGLKIIMSNQKVIHLQTNHQFIRWLGL